MLVLCPNCSWMIREGGTCMRCNNKGQMAGYEALIIIVLLGISGWMFYLYARKPSDSNVFNANSRPIVTEINNHPICGAIFDITKGVPNAVINDKNNK